VEKHTVQLVVTGRDLLLTPSKLDRKSAASVVVGDPDFDLGRNEAAEMARSVAGRPGPVEEGTRSATGLALGAIQRLPYTAAEARAVGEKLAEWAGTKPRLFTGKRAVEAAVKAVEGPRVLVLSTHGYFLPDQEDKKVKENPLLRCGLLLAGCNNPPRDGEAGDDGVLTGLEIVGTDLRGCDLVVLSACETGVGDVKDGEGVAGLRQAFQLAGAEAVVATLWQIPDRQSAQLMIRFFDELAAGKDKATALAEAQRAMIKERRAKSGAAHPFFWAAFTMTGRN
jgi:CHAT domain-containing protein